jgi:large subunit ribosomal protein L7/L12
MSNAMTRESLIDALSNLSILDAAALVKELEEKWGVSAAAPMMMGFAGAAAPAADAAEEQTEFSVVLVKGGDQKMSLIKELRTLFPGLSLKEAKDLSETANATVKEGLSKADADKIVKSLSAVGAEAKMV